MLRRAAELLKTEPEVVALSFARMADALGNSLLIIILPLYIAEQPSPWFSLPTETMIGVVISLYGFLFALGQPLAGIASDRLGRRKPFIVAGLALMTVATLGFMFAHRAFWILLLRCLQGLGVALILPAVLAIISSVTHKHNRGNAMGVYSAFRMTGFAVGPLLGGFLHVHFGYNVTFLTGAVCLATALILVQVTVKEVPAGQGGGSDAERVEEGNEPGGERAAGPDPADEDGWLGTSEKDTRRPGGKVSAGGRSKLLPSPTILALMFSTVVMASSLAMISSLENQFNSRLSQTAVGFGIAFSALTVSRLIVQIPIGRLSDRIGRKALIIGGMLALAPLTMLFGFVATTLQLVGVRLLQGVATAAVAAPAFALAGDLARKGSEGREMSFVTMGFGLGLGLGPLLAGALAGYVGFRVPFYVVGALAVAGAVIVWLWAEETITREEKPVGQGAAR